jgi:hypothetical protein
MKRRALHAIAALAFALLLPFPPAASAFTIDTTPAAVTNVTGLWWNPSESGWGVTLTQQGNVLFATMFTYDASRNPTWYVASSCTVSGGGCSGSLYRVTGGAAPTVPWTGSSASVTPVGTINFTFTDNSNGIVSFVINGVSGSRAITRQIFGSQQPSVDPNLAKTQQLVGGTWSYTYRIISTFTDRYVFTSLVSSTPDSSGNYFVSGTGEFGNLAVGGYNVTSRFWAVLAKGSIIDEFYTFTFSDNNTVSGCYYQINPPGSTNLSNCYSLVGTRSPPKALPQSAADRMQLEAAKADEAKSHSSAAGVDPAALEAYLRLRDSAR